MVSLPAPPVTTSSPKYKLTTSLPAPKTTSSLPPLFGTAVPVKFILPRKSLPETLKTPCDVLLTSIEMVSPEPAAWFPNTKL